MNIKKQLAKTLASLCLLLLELLLVSPDSLPVVWLFVAFILIFMFYYQAVLLIRLIWVRLSARTIMVKSGMVQSRIISSYLLVITLLQSLGQLSIRDILTFSLVFTGGYMYFYRLRQSK
jgi:hypothetical protein